MKIARLTTFCSSIALALGLLGSSAPAATSVPAFVAPWAVAVGLGGEAIGAAATLSAASAVEAVPPPTYPPSYPAANGATADAFSPASPPQELVCQTLPPSPPDTHDVTVCHYE